MHNLIFMSRLYVLICLVAGGYAEMMSSPDEGESWHLTAQEIDSLFHGMKWRNIGPFRGGRVTAVCGVVDDPHTYYFGSTGGGVWKTFNGGASWINVSDGFFRTGSVGAIAVAPSDPNVVYVGMGEAPIRGVMTSHGDGIYRSTDDGVTWQRMGLADTRQIAKVRVHPKDPDLVYVAAQGSPYKPTEDRGIFRSKDGGHSWEKVLFVNDSTGACDLSMDAANPRILYAAFWDHQRFPWKIRSGGAGSSIWKSTNGGDDWTRLSVGLPDSIMGKIGVSVSPANPQRVYALIESKQGGLYRSDNAGRTWKLINEDRVLRARSWYYMHVFADPVDPDKVVVLNAPFLQSTDGGVSFKTIKTPHGDNHDLWVNPNHPSIMINGNDGGANISYNAGHTWSTQMNQPTAQFYRVNADHQFPYHVYGGQQDNSTVALPNASTGQGIPFRDFYPVGGCESAFTAFDPDEPRFVYAGCYQGIITEYDTKLKVSKDIMAYSELRLGQQPADMKYRFNWNAPILVSRHDRSVIYHAGNQLLKSTDRGQSWQEVSPDLTKNIRENQEWGGGPITNEGAGGENYHTIMYVAESPHDQQVIWVGSDDGLIHVTKNGGTDWVDCTPPALQEGMINCIDASLHHRGKVYVAFNRYKFNDFTPYIYVTSDFGETWKLITAGIGRDAHVRVVREDPQVSGLLFAGTETGLYLSRNDGVHWTLFQLNLPVVPLTDLKIHQNDLIAATQGRAFWVLDDLTPLRLWDGQDHDGIEIFPPAPAYLWGGPRVDTLVDMGTNPDFGLMAYYYMPSLDDTTEIKWTIETKEGQSLRKFSSKTKKKEDRKTAKPGINKFVWDLIPDSEDAIKGLMTLGGNKSPKVGQGQYHLIIMQGSDTAKSVFTILNDPRLEIDKEAFVDKQNWLDKLDSVAQDLTRCVKTMRYVKEQIRQVERRTDLVQDSLIQQSARSLIKGLDSLEAVLVQKEQKTFQDVINFPNKLDAKIRHIQGVIENSYPPVTEGQRTRAEDVLSDWEDKERQWNSMLQIDIQAFNDIVKESQVPFISTSLPDEGNGKR